MSLLILLNLIIPLTLMAQTDEQLLKQLYIEMYEAMIAKDTLKLEEMMTEDSALVHMTGMRQPRREYLRAIKNGILNYFSSTDSDISVAISSEKAAMTGRSYVEAYVFGGGYYTWPLRLDIDWTKVGGTWKITEIRATTF